MPVKTFFRIAAWMLLTATATALSAQEADSLSGQTIKSLDKKGWNSGFQYRALLSSDMPDSVPVNPGKSGTVFFGMGGDITVAKFFSIRLQPGFTFCRLNFEENGAKTFPTDSNDIFTYEKLRSSYFELPVGLRFTLVRDKKDKPALVLEAGFSGGFLLGSSYKFHRKADGKETGYKISKADGLETIRYSVFGKLEYKGVGVFFNYRLSDYFKASKTYSKSNSLGIPLNDAAGTNTYPAVSQMEVGVVFDFN